MAEYIYDSRYDYPYYYLPSVFVTRAINIVFGIIEFMLAVRLVLQLLDANPGSAFIAWVYGLTDRFMGPFFGAFPAISIAGMTIDFSILLAMLAYAFIGWLIVRLVSLAFLPPQRIA